MAAKTRSKHQKDLYASYRAANRQATNRKKKLERALKRNPENEQIATALKNISYRRKTPNTSQWSQQQVAFAMLTKLFKKPLTTTITPCSGKQMSTLKERAHTQGVRTWKS